MIIYIFFFFMHIVCLPLFTHTPLAAILELRRSVLSSVFFPLIFFCSAALIICPLLMSELANCLSFPLPAVPLHSTFYSNSSLSVQIPCAKVNQNFHFFHLLTGKLLNNNFSFVFLPPCDLPSLTRN